MQQQEGNEKCFFALKLMDDPADTAYLWSAEAQGFVRFQFNPDTGFERTADVIKGPKHWSAIAWFTAEGLRQFLAWPEFLALDETYKAYLLFTGQVSRSARTLYQVSGIRGDHRTYTGFRTLIAETSSEEIIRWTFSLALPLLLSEFAPRQHLGVLSAVNVITMDAALAQRAVFEEIAPRTFPSADLRFCYWHTIRKVWDDKISPHLSAQIREPAKANVLKALKFIFLSAESSREQKNAYKELTSWIRGQKESKSRQLVFVSHSSLTTLHSRSTPSGNTRLAR